MKTSKKELKNYVFSEAERLKFVRNTTEMLRQMEIKGVSKEEKLKVQVFQILKVMAESYCVQFTGTMLLNYLSDENALIGNLHEIYRIIHFRMHGNGSGDVVSSAGFPRRRCAAKSQHIAWPNSWRKAKKNAWTKHHGVPKIGLTLALVTIVADCQ